MSLERHLRRKLTLRAHDEQIVFVKRKHERIEHVWMKAFLWALYLPEYPDLAVEIQVDDKYKPDVVAMDPRRGAPRFWGEAGQVSVEKIEALVQRYPNTHFALSKWATSLDSFIDIIRNAMAGTSRRAPIDLIRFPADSATRFIDARGHIALDPEVLTRRRVASSTLNS